ncbi:hypothetical protein EV182_002172 [Spiromyces aspiralis]|uniref:Uncharacterized protein n=1 Tax=Spiromyces aspiralis TaxID=68401 RepID=A0ACC1HEJ0_9FUNG|nr:hypothetical protein EV182_002172 [Spiromyces aspiralis]
MLSRIAPRDPHLDKENAPVADHHRVKAASAAGALHAKTPHMLGRARKPLAADQANGKGNDGIFSPTDKSLARARLRDITNTPVPNTLRQKALKPAVKYVSASALKSTACRPNAIQAQIRARAFGEDPAMTKPQVRQQMQPSTACLPDLEADFLEPEYCPPKAHIFSHDEFDPLEAFGFDFDLGLLHSLGPPPVNVFLSEITSSSYQLPADIEEEPVRPCFSSDDEEHVDTFPEYHDIESSNYDGTLLPTLSLPIFEQPSLIPRPPVRSSSITKTKQCPTQEDSIIAGRLRSKSRLRPPTKLH